ncbi:hypothetical protein [Campylobacter concisus]|jgi:hypothetical protein|uniref:hypothetical protein n=1 Tax=Campylobacter concisus TaxID=199 RepID=UPI00122C2F00|nr:hypothetical protein [Campylobacter concisus]
MVVFRFFILISLFFTFFKAEEIGYYYENEKFLIATPMFECEGDIHCTNGGYFGVNKRNSKSLEILSKPTPIKNSVNERLMGYKFKNSNYIYEIYGDIMSGGKMYLNVFKQGKTIFKSDDLQQIEQEEFLSKLKEIDKRLPARFEKFYKRLQNKYKHEDYK